VFRCRRSSTVSNLMRFGTCTFAGRSSVKIASNCSRLGILGALRHRAGLAP
jgi:hypothetical protein